MPKGHSILTLSELSPAEIRFLLRLAAELKAAQTEKNATEWLDIASTTNAELRVCHDQSEALSGADSSIPTCGRPWVRQAQVGRAHPPACAISCHEREPAQDRQSTCEVHALPAGSHNTEATVGSEIAQAFAITCIEVTEEVFEGPAIVFDQARTACTRSSLCSSPLSGPDRCGSS